MSKLKTEPKQKFADKVDKLRAQKLVVPIGVESKHIWLERRVRDIGDAILRHVQAGYTVNASWVDERNAHIMELTRIPSSIYYKVPEASAEVLPKMKVTAEDITAKIQNT